MQVHIQRYLAWMGIRMDMTAHVIHSNHDWTDLESIDRGSKQKQSQRQARRSLARQQRTHRELEQTSTVQWEIFNKHEDSQIHTDMGNCMRTRCSQRKVSWIGWDPEMFSPSKVSSHTAVLRLFIQGFLLHKALRDGTLVLSFTLLVLYQCGAGPSTAKKCTQKPKWFSLLVLVLVWLWHAALVTCTCRSNVKNQCTHLNPPFRSPLSTWCHLQSQDE